MVVEGWRSKLWLRPDDLTRRNLVLGVDDLTCDKDVMEGLEEMEEAWWRWRARPAEAGCEGLRVF